MDCDTPATETLAPVPVHAAAPAWQAPELVELRLGMEVTSYEGADIEPID